MLGDNEFYCNNWCVSWKCTYALYVPCFGKEVQRVGVSQVASQAIRNKLNDCGEKYGAYDYGFWKLYKMCWCDNDINHWVLM